MYKAHPYHVPLLLVILEVPKWHPIQLYLNLLVTLMKDPWLEFIFPSNSLSKPELV
jgi:hypothetical protein